MRVRVYRNRRKKCWSVQAANGRLLKHAASVHLEGVTFVVRPGGYRRTQSTGHRGVHAFAVGTLRDSGPAGTVEVTYDPFGAAEFVERAGGAVVRRADYATAREDGTFWVIRE